MDSLNKNLAEQLTQSRKLLLETKKKYYSQHFYEFNRDILAWPDIYEPLHRPVCDFIQDNIGKKKVLLLLPRGTFKSSIVTVGYCLWRIAKDPNQRVLIANATHPMATSFLGQVKNHLLRNEKFKAVFGNLAETTDSWREDRIAITRDKSFEQKEPTVWAQGTQSNTTGSHFNLAILDDIVARENIGTKDQIEKVKNFYKDVLDLVDPNPEGGKEVIIIGTTWHFDDLYAWIQDKENNIVQDFAIMRLPAYEGEWKKGKLLFPERLDWKTLDELKRSQGTFHFCTPSESPVIMSDLSVKQISEIKKGDSVLGWNDTPGLDAKLTKAKVKKVFEYKREVVEMKMESGRIARCTPDHKWFTGRGYTDKSHLRYKPAKVGSRLMYILNPEIPELTEKQQQLAYWLGGFFDGEGSCGEGYQSIKFSQHKYANPLLWRKMQEVCDELGFEYNLWEKEVEEKNKRKRSGYNCVMWLNGGKQTKMDFLNLCKPFRKERVINTVLGKTNFIQNRDKVLNIRSLGEQKVYALETETGNYIVWGYGSSNSAQYMLNPIPEENQTFKPPFKRYEETDLSGVTLNKFMTIDPALSESKSADFSAIVVIGVDRNNTWYILDIWREQVLPNRLIDQIFYMDEKWKPSSIGLETVAFQRILQYQINDEMKKRNRFIPIKELKHTDQSKEDRIRSLQPRYEVGTIFHPQKNTHPLVEYLEDELQRFPRAKNDDIIDALAGMNELAFPPRHKEERKQVKRNIYPA